MAKFTAEEARTRTDIVIAADVEEQEELAQPNNIRAEMRNVFGLIRDAATFALSKVTLDFNSLILDGDFNIKKNKIKTRLGNLGYIVAGNVISW